MNNVIYPTKVIESQAETIELQDKEIEKLNNDIKELLKENENKEKVIKAQDSIIKEVRKWLNKTIFYFDFEKEVTSHTFELLYTAQGQELSRILDKGE